MERHSDSFKSKIRDSKFKMRLSMSVDPSTLPNDEVAYDASTIQHLVDADHIRKRPDNYIPDRSERGLHHLVYELVYNAVDEHLAGHCNLVHVTVHIDGSLSVSDDGRGIPVEIHPKMGISTLEGVMTKVGMGGKFDNKAYKTSAGLHGMGAKAVTALSELTRAEVRREGRVFQQEYVKGKASTSVTDIGASDHNGTRITFWPDPEIFGQSTFEFEILQGRLRELAFLNRGLRIILKDERNGKEDTFYFEGGVAEYVAFLNQAEDVLHPPILINRDVEIDTPGGEGARHTIKVEVALQYSTSDQERVRCYANNQYNPNGGTHLSGFRTGLTRSVKAYGEKEKMFKDDMKPEGEDFRDGLTAIVNINLPNPQFEAQTKIRLNNPEVEAVVAAATAEILSKYLEENPKESKKIIQKVILAAEVRKAEAKARQAVRERKNILSGGGLPGKLMDCTSKDRDKSEMFLVEGDSAGGSAESGRDRMYQAVLPLRGKPLNVEKARFDHLLSNQEIVSIIAAVGIDIGNPEDISKLRYGKIVILTDADVDGQHIRTLLLTFFFRQMRKLIDDGHLYVARPPLFKVTQKKQARFIATLEEMARELMSRGLNNTKFRIVNQNPPKEFEGDQLKSIVETLDRLDANLNILERRGIPLATLAPLVTEKGMPSWHVKFNRAEHWFFTQEEANAFRQSESTRIGKEIVLGDLDQEAAKEKEAGQTQQDEIQRMYIDEFHEIKQANRWFAKLTELGFTFTDLLPPVRVAGREPALRFTLDRDDNSYPLTHLRDLVNEVRRLGEKGLTITRFKGLGEMDPEELWDTTLDPSKRTLLQVTMSDAERANELFRVLMGEEVEKRRNFIFEKGINVKDQIDYGS
jgi:DNA gyrase subunit B